jgi:hypothetical protein
VNAPFLVPFLLETTGNADTHAHESSPAGNGKVNENLMPNRRFADTILSRFTILAKSSHPFIRGEE